MSPQHSLHVLLRELTHRHSGALRVVHLQEGADSHQAVLVLVQNRKILPAVDVHQLFQNLSNTISMTCERDKNVRDEAASNETILGTRFWWRTRA